MLRLPAAVLLPFLIVSMLSCQQQPSPHTPAQAERFEFEGVITYATTLEAKSTAIDENQLNALYGDTLKWYYRKGAYHWQYNGTGVQDVFYTVASNTEYTRRSGVDTLFARDVSVESRSLDSLYATGATRVVSGRNCKEFMMHVNATRHTYCVDEQLRINPAHYTAFRSGFQNELYALAPGAYLAYRYESPVFVIEREAVHVDEQPLRNGQLVLPDLPVKAL